MIGTKRRVQGSDDTDTESENSEPLPEVDCEESISEAMHLEPWEEWIKRATSMAEEQLAKVGLEDWSNQQRRNYWRWAGHVTRRSDGRWSVSILRWTPAEGARRVGRPTKRWIDELHDFINCRVEDAQQARRLRYILGHAGESVDGRGHKSREKWRSMWAESEVDFVAS